MELFSHGHFWSNFSHVLGPRVYLAFEHRFRKSVVKKTQLPYWLMLYVIDGNAKVEIVSQSRIVEPAPCHLYLFPPELHLVDHIPGDRAIHSCYLCFANGRQTELPKMMDGRTCGEFYDGSGEVGQLLRQIAAAGQAHGDAGFWQAQGFFCHLIGLLSKANEVGDGRWILGSDESGELPHETKLSTRVYEYLHANINNMITLNDIADAIGVSVSTLSHSYQDETGITPIKAYAQMRIERIKEMLKLGVPLKLIARQMSFGDSSSLSNFFKRNVGISPRQFLQ